MSIAFSQSMRSLKADGYRPALIGLIVAIMLLSAWCAWFFLAEVTLYEGSQAARISHGEIVTVDFPRQKLSRIQPGQPARLSFEGSLAKQVGSIPAIVTDIVAEPQATQGQVKLLALPDKGSPIFFQDELTARIEIEVEHVSPAELVMRTSGLFIETPKVSVSPQPSER